MAAGGGFMAGGSGFSSSDSPSVRTPGSGSSSSSEPSSLLSNPHSTKAYKIIGDLQMYSWEIFGNLKVNIIITYL